MRPPPPLPAKFNWTGNVQSIFVTLAAGAIAASVVLTDPQPWMVAAPILVFLSMGLAFTRVWKSFREEQETAPIWDEADVTPRRGNGITQAHDAIFEIPYVFSLVFLPGSVISLQTFSACLLLFYISDNYYNLELIRTVRDDGIAHRTAGRRWLRWAPAPLDDALLLAVKVLDSASARIHPMPTSVDRAVLQRYFVRRARYNAAAIWLLVIVFLLALLGPRDWAEPAGIVAVSVLLLMELVIEPYRGVGIHHANPDEGAAEAADAKVVRLWPVPRGAALDSATKDWLRSTHDQAFAEAERQFSAGYLLSETGRHGQLLLLLTIESDDSTERERAGYLFLEARPRHEVVFLWYLAIDSDRRGEGLGHDMVSLAIELVMDRWPGVRYALLEVGRPEVDASGVAPSAATRLIGFYRDLGFHWVRGVEYELPSAVNRAESVRYDPMFLHLQAADGPPDTQTIKAAIREMARDEYVKLPDDPRWKRLRDSLDSMDIVAPTASD
jgi:ribosomal protein S18 acetylase RimI-like enzyme